MNNHTTKRKPYYEANEVGRKYLCRLEERRKTDYNDLSFENGKDFCSDLNKNVIRISEVKMPSLFFLSCLSRLLAQDPVTPHLHHLNEEQF